MCSLCGELSTRPHWTDRSPDRAARLTYARALLGAHGLGLVEWQRRYLVSNGRGRTEVVNDLGACWVAAERLVGRPVDPLEPAAAAALGEAACAR